MMTPLASRTLAISILVAIVGASYAFVIAPVLDEYLSTSQSVEAMRGVLERYRQKADQLPALHARLAELRRRSASASGFLQNASDALAAVQIQERVKALVGSAPGALKSTQVLPVQEEGKFRRVAIRVDMTMDVAAAQRFFYAIETGSPALFFDNLDIHGPTIASREDQLKGVLNVKIDVYGYLRRTEAIADFPARGTQGGGKAETNATLFRR